MSAQNRVPLWLDCDPGHDDAFAILLAAHHPRLNLLGLSTVYGNASLSHTTANAIRILKAIGRSDVPVYSGASRPFAREPVHAPDIHGESGLDGTELLPEIHDIARYANAEPAVLAMRNAVLSQPSGSVWVVATGAWTNIALLFASFPEVASHVAGVSVMGGAVGGRFSEAIMGKVVQGVWTERIGNTTPWAEFNVYCDPESARSLLCNPLLQDKLVVIPLDVTHLALATEAIRQRILGDHRPEVQPWHYHPLRQMFYDLLMFFASTYRDVFGFADGPPLHDPLAVAVILDMLGIEDFRFEDGENIGEEGNYWIANVYTAGEHESVHQRKDTATGNKHNENQLGRTILLRQATEGVAGVRVPRRIRKLDNFWDAIELSLQKAEIALGGIDLWSKP